LRELGRSEGGLTLTALTFQPTDDGFEFYAVIENQSDEPICYGGITVNFLDGAEQVLAFWGEALSSQLYLMDEGSGGFIQCVEPGGVSMTGTQKLPDGIVETELEVVEYSLPAFALAGVVLCDDVTVSPLQLVQMGEKTAFSGLVQNHLEVAVTSPKLNVFTLTDEGRPVGMATASETIDIDAGSTWSFETNSLDDTGSEAVSFVNVSLPE